MTSYCTLADEAHPSVDEFDDYWAGIRKEFLAFRSEEKEPIVFTEVGW